MAATRTVHVTILSLGLSCTLVVLLAIATVYDAPTSAPRYPKYRWLQQQDKSKSVIERNQNHDRSPLQRRVLGVAEELSRELAGCKEAKEKSEVKGFAQYNMAPSATGRDKTWPELVGIDSEEAKNKILKDHPNLQVHVLPADSMVTLDYRLDRVRIFKDADNKVARAPRIG